MKKDYFDAVKKHIKRGFTLVELVIALVVIAIISVILMGVFTYAYRLQFQEKSITQNTYRLQQEVEKRIALERETVRLADGTVAFKLADGTEVLNDVFVSGNDVEYKQLSISIDDGNHKFYTLVAKEKQIIESIPAITEASLNLVKKIASETGRPNEKYEYQFKKDNLFGVAEYKIGGEFKVSAINSSSSFSSVLVQLYVSKQGFSVPDTFGVVNSAKLDIFPEFPRDFELVQQKMINDTTIRTFDFEVNPKDYRGKHLIVEVIPISQRGVFGKSKVTDSVFIHGIDNFTNLIVHYDFSIIPNKSGYYDKNTNEVRKIGNLADKKYKPGSSEYLPLDVSGIGLKLVNGYKDTSFTGFMVRLPVDKKLVMGEGKISNGDNLTLVVLSKNGITGANIEGARVVSTYSEGDISGGNFPSGFKVDIIQLKSLGKKIALKSNSEVLELGEVLLYKKVLSVTEKEDVINYYKISKFSSDVIDEYVFYKILSLDTLKLKPGNLLRQMPKFVDAAFKNKEGDIKIFAVDVVWNIDPSIELPQNFTGADVVYTGSLNGVAEGGIPVSAKAVIATTPVKISLLPETNKFIVFDKKIMKVGYKIEAVESGVVIPSSQQFKIGISVEDGNVADISNHSDGSNASGVYNVIASATGNFWIIGKKDGTTKLRSNLVGYDDVQSDEREVIVAIPVLWLDGTDNSDKYMQMSDAGGGSIVSWKDLSGNNNHFNAVGNPTFVSGGGVLFNGKKQYFLRNGLGGINYGNGEAKLRNSTVFVVATNFNKGKGTAYSQARTIDNNATLQLAIDSSSKTLSVSTGGTLNFARVNGTSFADMSANKFISVAQTEGVAPKDGIQARLYANVSLYNATSVVSSGMKVTYAKESGHENADFTIGAAKNQKKPYDYFKGTIYEVIVFNRTLSDEEIAWIVQYLRTKWGIN